VGISKNEDVVISIFEMPTLHRRKIKHNNEPSNYMKKNSRTLQKKSPNFPNYLDNLVEFTVFEMYIFIYGLPSDKNKPQNMLLVRYIIWLLWYYKKKRKKTTIKTSLKNNVS
jgi:hypothetical protein